MSDGGPGLLDGVKVVSFNHFLLGPHAMQTLGDLGADIIAIEPLNGAFQRQWGGADKRIDGQTTLFLCANRNKRSLALDLKASEGQEIAWKLIARADVVSENFRTGVMEKLGFGYDALQAANPDVIFASASGFGPDGPYVKRPGQDLLIQAMSGLAAITGNTQDRARAVGVALVDVHAGSLLATGILAALVRRARTGEGCRVDVNLLSAAIDLQSESFSTYLNGPRPDDVRPPRFLGGWYYPGPYGIYTTADGHLAISFSNHEHLADALSLPALAAISNSDGYARREDIASLIAPVLETRSTDAWLEVFKGRDIWCAPVNDYEDVLRDPQIRHNACFETIPGATGTPITIVAHPIRYDGATPGVRLPPQPLGAQTEEVLREIGYGSEAIARLEANGVIGVYRPAVAERLRDA